MRQRELFILALLDKVVAFPVALMIPSSFFVSSKNAFREEIWEAV